MHFSSAVPPIRRFAVVSFVCATLGSAVSVGATGNDALLAIDQDRPGVIERIVSKWAAPIARSDAQMPVDELRSMLEMLRADQLRAASLAGTLDGVRDVLANAMVASSMTKPSLGQTKALGDTTIDSVYTPVTPCRLVETRGVFGAVYQGNGTASHTPVPFTSNEIRTYTVQGGNGVCLSQLPVGLGVSAVQLQVFGMPTSAASGDIEILPQGSVFGATATMVYVGSIAFNTVSTAARINPANNQISVQVRGGGALLAIDVVGYFKRPGNYVDAHVVGGIGATDGGGSNNTASGDYSTVAGGLNNVASGTFAMLPGGEGNTASGSYSFAAGWHANADQNQCFLFANWNSYSGSAANCLNVTNIARFIMNHGLSVDYGSARADGGGTRWVAIGNIFANQTISTWTGAFLSDAGVWVNASSAKSHKTDFAPVDVQQVLAKVAELPITTWRYREGEGAVRHIGPMAEDFHAAFGVGYGPQTIADLDARGVALAAIQGLHRRVQDREATITAQQREIEAQQRAIAAQATELARLGERLQRLEREGGRPGP
jgi:hypothetical protein